eukprot:TRINITY_DN10352_c0_g1_i1.p1 TRINITY_DN10352_c0_g1~~TRINITY_DN10352_c0_g1_i1.p1  ORF type:complete len:358 (-),score=57.78 TRINITY_DN10352_c0_g1_i1:60-1064(-)
MPISPKQFDPHQGKFSTATGRHTGWVRTVALSPSRTRLATCDDASSLKIWDAATEEVVESFTDRTVHLAQVTSAVWLTEKYVACSSKQIIIWDLVSRRPLCYSAHTDTIWELGVSSDRSRLIATSFDRSYSIWRIVFDSSGGIELEQTRTVTTGVWSVGVSFHPKIFSMAAIGLGHGAIHIVDTETGEHNELRPHSQPVNRVAFSCSGNLLATGSDDCTVRIFETQTWTERFSVTMSAPVYGVCFVNDDQLLGAICRAQKAGFEVIDTRSGEVVRDLDTKEQPTAIAVVHGDPWSEIGALRELCSRKLARDRTIALGRLPEHIAMEIEQRRTEM